MSRKPHPPLKRSPAVDAAPADAESQALAHLEKGRYREAVTCYKTLLKTERRPEWLAGLASAYSGRALGLADKGMLQEAIGLWRSRAELCGTPLWSGPYASWLIATGRLADVLDQLALKPAANPATHLAADVQPEDVSASALQAQLAPALLSANPATLARLPAASLLAQHQPMAVAALAAYSGQDAEGMEAALAGISFRSPYRDLRTLLKALVLYETDRDAARIALERLPSDSPFAALAAPLRAAVQPGPACWQAWSQLNPAQQSMALGLMGYPAAAAPLFQALATALRNPSVVAPPALFDLVLRGARDLPNALATRAWQWLAPWAARKGCANPRLFGSPSKADQELATALAVEISGDWNHAESHWFTAASLLELTATPQDRLRAALVLRHMALSKQHLSSDGVLDNFAQELLTNSLRLDPYDCAAHVLLIQTWRRAGNLKRAREQIDTATALYPDDVALLSEMVEVAVAAGAFKKAATHARRLLLLDPLNRKVRGLVGNAHLSHAAKQIGADKPDAAKNEIAEAANWLSASADQGRMHLLQAWTEPAGSAERPRLAKAAVSAWGGGLAAGWLLVREAQATFPRIDPDISACLLEEAGIDRTLAITPAQLLALVPVLEQATPVQRKGLDSLAIWRKRIAALASADANQAFDYDTCVRLCEAFSRHHDHDLLGKFANTSRKRWPDQPVFTYHAVAARFGKNGAIKTEKDFQDLEAAGEQAAERKDFRLVARIEALFDDDGKRYAWADDDLEMPQGMPAMPFDNFFPDEDKLRAMMETAIQMDGSKLFLKNARRDLGDALMKQVEKECAGNKKLYLRRILDLVVAQFSGAQQLIEAIGAATNDKLDMPNPKPLPGRNRVFDE